MVDQSLKADFNDLITDIAGSRPHSPKPRANPRLIRLSLPSFGLKLIELTLDLSTLVIGYRRQVRSDPLDSLEHSVGVNGLTYRSGGGRDIDGCRDIPDNPHIAGYLNCMRSLALAASKCQPFS
jgi:hypothetical protein